MPELTLHEVSVISADVRRQEITFSHLADDLVDHLCCDVEYEMEAGLPFADAYRRVKERMGMRRLKEIQEETLYSVDTKYRKMKNTMKISSVAGTVLFGFAALFKIMHWPGAGIMLSLGALVLAFVFMPSALVVLWKESHSSRKLLLYIASFLAAMLIIFALLFKVQHWPMAGLVSMLAAVTAMFLFLPSLLAVSLRRQENREKRIVYIIGATGLFLFISGFLFKVQHWPLAGEFMLTGLVLSFFVAFPWYVRATWKDEQQVTARFIFMVCGSMALVIPALLINLQLQRDFETEFYVELDGRQKRCIQLTEMNNALAVSSEDTLTMARMTETDSRTDELIRLVTGVEMKIVSVAEGKPGQPADVTGLYDVTAAGPVLKAGMLQNTLSPYPYSLNLSGPTETRTMLDEAMKEYRLFLEQYVGPEMTGRIAELLDPALYLSPGDRPDQPVSVITSLNMLAMMKNGILAAESAALSALKESKR